jgi:hypothetical protein
MNINDTYISTTLNGCIDLSAFYKTTDTQDAYLCHEQTVKFPDKTVHKASQEFIDTFQKNIKNNY